MLDIRSPIPLYAQLRELLREQIQSGQWKIGDMIPPEQVMAAEYGVARATVRQAIMDLVGEGLLYRKQGKGTFVCRSRRLDAMEPLLSFSAEMISRGVTPGARVLKQEMAGTRPSEVASLFGVDHPVFRLERLRLADGVPLALEYSYLDAELVPGLEKEDLEGSLYQLLIYGRGIQVSRVEQSIGSSRPDQEQARMLEIDPADSVLVLERTMYTGESPFYWLRFLYRSDMYRFYTVLEGLHR